MLFVSLKLNTHETTKKLKINKIFNLKNNFIYFYFQSKIVLTMFNLTIKKLAMKQIKY